MTQPNKKTEVTIRRFVRPMRDTLAAAEQTVFEFVNSNGLVDDFVLSNHKSIYIPLDFSGIYQASFDDVMKTELGGNLCYVAVEYVFQTKQDINLKLVKIPDSEGIVFIETIERLTVDGEPV
jgi:hypothetical protein